MQVLDKGFVTYVDHLGSDQRIVEAARVSYQSPSKGEYADKNLIHYLWKNQHTSPYEQCSVSFHIKMPIFVMRQFVRHRTFRLNEVSGRYSEIKPDFYIPTKWRKQDTVNKQGSIESDDFDPTIEYSNCDGGLASPSYALDNHCERSYTLYKDMIKEGIAKEMARMILPLNTYTEIYVNCDLHNLFNFIRLRSDSKAQWEIREYANAMFKMTKELFPWACEAFEWYTVQVKDNYI